MYRKILAILICAVMVTFVGCKSKKPAAPKGNSSAGNSAETSTQSETKEPAKVYYFNNLTGEESLVSEDKVNDRPVAVMINNAWEGSRGDAQKVQTGLAKADIVYETEVEGGITRLMAVYKDISTVEKLGTVRSARYPYIDLAMGHGAIYVHHGQDNTYAKPHLRDTQTFILDTNNAGVRDKGNGMSLEHTLYGYGKKIWQWFEKKGYNTELKTVNNWQTFAAKDTPVKFTDAATEVTVNFSSKYRSVFKYDSASGKYIRFFRDIERKDYYTGEKEYFKNVFVLETSITYYPDGKHKRVDLSSGSGYYCVNGTYTKIKWEKGASSNGIKFKNLDGTPLEVNPGNSWVCLHGKSFSPSFK